MNFKLTYKNKIIISLIIVIALISLSSVSAAITIKGASFSTGSDLEDKTYATIYVGSKYAGDDVIIQIWYSRDGTTLNNGNMVPVTVDSNGYIDVASADAYEYYPDHAKINLYNSNSKLLDTYKVSLSPSSGTQSFGSGDFDDAGSSSSSYQSSSSSGDESYGNYVGNSATGKFHSSGCGDINKMSESNKVFFTSRDDAVNSGYSPCGHCHP